MAWTIFEFYVRELAFEGWQIGIRQKGVGKINWSMHTWPTQEAAEAFVRSIHAEMERNGEAIEIPKGMMQ